MEEVSSTINAVPKIIGRKPCPHRVVLPKGLYCDRGYLFVRVWVDGRRFLKCYGVHTSANQKIATIQLNKISEQRYFGTFEFPDRVERKKFSEVCDIYFHHAWFANPRRSEVSKYNGKVRLNQYKTVFGDKWFDEISPSDILNWRKKREKTAKVSTVNRDQRGLSAIFNEVRRLVETKVVVPGFQFPKDNPCKFVKLPSEDHLARQRVPSKEEFIKAKQWCMSHDTSLWDIIHVACITGRRKSELKRLGVGSVTGLQTKTGGTFNLPIEIRQSLDWTNFDDRYDLLRKYMGWFDKNSPTYTTFHDLKHYAPSILAEQGYNDTMIQHFTQHKDPKMARRYTNPRDLMPLVKAVESTLKF